MYNFSEDNRLEEKHISVARNTVQQQQQTAESL